MRKIILIIALLFVGLLIPLNESYSWGFYAHKRINRMAVFTLPPEMIGFYKKHIDYVTEHATDPDRRRSSKEGEAPLHYIDVDHYGKNPFDSIPVTWKKAIEKYTEDTLIAYGIVPWHVEKMMYRLTEAFKKNDVDKILYLSADIGHYIADAHVPLHTTENYNGQLTNQKGIHGFWESRIPELKAEEYNYLVGRAQYVDYPLKKIWSAVKASFAAKDSVLLFEAELSRKFPSDRKYSFENRNNSTIKTYSEEYTNEYNLMLNGMVERRMLASIITVGSLWYTAWVNAGQPDLNIIENKEISDSLKNALKSEEESWRNAKTKTIKGHED